MVYQREGSASNPHEHKLIADIPISAIECDGADAININLGDRFPEGIFVAMSDEKVFHIYDWRDLQEWINNHPVVE